jgi:hypothetical protein
MLSACKTPITGLHHAPRHEAINVSGTVHRPRRKGGGVMASIASIVSVGSARRETSVVCLSTWPNQRETLRRSPVACTIIMAHVGRTTCGVTCVAAREGPRCAARRTYMRMDRPASLAATMAHRRSRSASASRVVARRSRAIRGCSRRTRGRHALGVSIHPNRHVCPQALQSPERLIPVCCAVAPHTPSPGDVWVTASQRFCGTVVAETRR